jgi:multimeric flavodoxin WrbA
MKVLMIEGCKKAGKTDVLCDAFAKGAGSNGHEVTREYLLNRQNVHGCIDCQTCRRTGSCIWKDDLTEIMPEVLEADVLVFASPVYFFSISSQLKQFMDRTYAVMEKIHDKKLYFITTAEGPSSMYAEQFRMVDVPVKAWAACYEGMDYVRMLAYFDTGTGKDMESTEVYGKALKEGASF